ncbi:MAG TPA: ABC transporter ATP-binding protein [Actinomycetota bacterium]|nr:ABC transporter ATP-binding protein [Actinomycetota bacterium]
MLNLQLTRPRRRAMAALQVRSLAETVVVRAISRSFGGTPVLGGVDLDVRAGSLVALLGPSGCGKTTLLRTIAGLETPDGGRVEIGDRTVVDAGRGIFVAPERRRVGMVFQDAALFPHLSVGANVAFGLPRHERRSDYVTEVLRMVDLDGLVARDPCTLSGGQQQRVALARALANKPSVILLDEPFSNLDATLRVQIRLEVRRVLRDLGVSALFVTHDQEEAFSLGESVAVMFDGVVDQQASPSEIYEAPATRRVAEFIGDGNFIPGDARDRVAETRFGNVPLARDASGPVDVMLRAEELLVHPGDEALIEEVVFYGHDAVYIVKLPDGSRFHSRVLATPEFRPGDRVDLKYSGRPTVAFPRST